MLKNCIIFLFIAMFLSALVVAKKVSGWSNGGYSDDPSHPNYGTHDWIAQHALDWLPPAEKQFILSNLAAYLYGTELPDRPASEGGIGDSFYHHVYYHADCSLQDDASAVKAQEKYDAAVDYFKHGDLVDAAKMLGAVSHYIADMAVFGHVMGADTDWSSEKHHSDYETYVNERTSGYDAEFNTFLSFDGTLNEISAYNATLTLAYDTTFDTNGDLTCVWMDQNYDWNNPTFANRCCESINLAVNLIADVLHTFYSEAAIPEFPNSIILSIFVIIATLVVVSMRKTNRGKNFIMFSS